MTSINLFDTIPKRSRHCGECNLCCKLLPVRELDKGAGQRCQHQSHAKGCTVYQQPAMPLSCRLWSCAWLVQDETADLSRPDRAHYVIDIMPDFITAEDNATGQKTQITVVQVWVDPKYPDAHRDPALRAYLDRRARERGEVALIRYSNTDGFVLVPPSMNDGEWLEHRGVLQTDIQHSADEILQATGRIF